MAEKTAQHVGSACGQTISESIEAAIDHASHNILGVLT